MDRETIERIAAGYVDYALWFVREGSAKFQAHQARMRERFAPQFDQILDAVVHGSSIAAVLDALRGSAGEFQSRADELAFETHPNEWASDRVSEIVSLGGPSAWELVLEIVRRAPDDEDVLGFIGAGPVESWMSEERVAEVAGELTAELQRSVKLQRVVLTSWHIPPTLERILRQLGAWPT
jgi:hypothetical protein